MVISKGAVFAEPADNSSVGKLAGFKTVSPPLHKFYLEEGQHTITVEVENQKTTKQKKVEKKVFSTQDWRSNNTKEDKVAVNFDVYGQGTIPNTDINMVFTSEDGRMVSHSNLRKVEVTNTITQGKLKLFLV